MPGSATTQLMKLLMGTPEEQAEVEREREKLRQSESEADQKKAEEN